MKIAMALISRMTMTTVNVNTELFLHGGGGGNGSCVRNDVLAAMLEAPVAGFLHNKLTQPGRDIKQLTFSFNISKLIKHKE